MRKGGQIEERSRHPQAGGGSGQKIARAIQYFAEDWEVVQKELAAGKEALEKLHEISGQALGKE